jgi:hypothetical protein
MSTIYRMPKGQWRAQERRKGRCTMSPPAPDMQHTATGEQLSGNHPEGRPLQAPRRSIKAVIRRLKDDPGGAPLADPTRERLIMNTRQRARDGAGPATLAVDLAFTRRVLTPAAAMHGISVNTGAARLARDERADLEKFEPEGAAGCVCEQGLAGTAGDVCVQAPGIPPRSGVTTSSPIDYRLGLMRRR